MNGTGVKIGVLSDGVEYLAEAQASGDLGSVTVLPGQQGLGNEGTAMLEIIHDVAPGAELFFASGVNNLATGFAENIRARRRGGLRHHRRRHPRSSAESPFQDGQAPGTVVSAIQRRCGHAGGKRRRRRRSALFFFGGQLRKQDRWQFGGMGRRFCKFRTYDASAGQCSPNVNYHDFDPTENVEQFNRITAGGYPSPIVLHWNDPLGGSTNDYDMYILGPTAQSVMVFSNNVQNGTQDPFEGISQEFNNTNFRIVVVQKQGAQDRFLHLSNYDGLLRFATAGETYGHPAASGSFGVAAVPVVPTFPDAFTSANQVEIFSSDGPRRIFFKADGTPITPGNLSSTGGAVIQQPVFAAADGVSTSGMSPFFGTSAAAPHAAAIAARVMSADPTLTPAQVKNELISSAIDIEAPGVDRDSGYGIVMPYDALADSAGGSSERRLLRSARRRK